jgi:hypothetical protein
VRVTLDGRPVSGARVRQRSRGFLEDVITDSQGACRLLLRRDRQVDVLVEAQGAKTFAARLCNPDESLVFGVEGLMSHLDVIVGEPPDEDVPVESWEEEGLNFDALEIDEASASQVLRLALVTHFDLAGRVVDSKGAPVPNARVWSHDEETRTNAQGAFSLKLPLPVTDSGLGEPTVFAQARGVGYASIEAEAAEVPGRLSFAPLELQLVSGRVFKGRVVDDRGVGVQAWVVVRQGLFAERFWRMRSAADGSFRLEGLGGSPRSWLQVNVSCKAPGHETWEESLSLAPGAKAPTVVLRRMASFQGRVVDGAGKPVRAARLRYLPSSGLLARRYGVSQSGLDADVLFEVPAAVTACDPNGRFALDLPRGSGWLVVRAPGFGEALVEVAPPAKEVTIRLSPGLELAGTIHTPEGEPLDYRLLLLAPAGRSPAKDWDEDVRLVPTGKTHTLELAKVPTAISAAMAHKGEFKFKDVPAGRFDCYVYGVYHGAWQPILVAEGLVAGKRDLTLSFTPAPSVKVGVLVRGPGGKVPQDIRVRCFDAKGEVVASGSADAEGRVTVSTWDFGPLELEVRAHGCLPRVVPVEVRPGGPHQVGEVALVSGGAKLVVSLQGAESYLHCVVSAKDPVTHKPVAAVSALSGDARLLFLSPGAIEVEVACYGVDRKPLKVVTRSLTLSGEMSLSIDLAR